MVSNGRELTVIYVIQQQSEIVPQILITPRILNSRHAQMLLHHQADILGLRVLWLKKTCTFKCLMVSYESAVSIQPNHFSTIERKLI